MEDCMNDNIATVTDFKSNSFLAYDFHFQMKWKWSPSVIPLPTGTEGFQDC